MTDRPPAESGALFDALKANRDAFIIFTHFENERIRTLIRTLRAELEGRADVYVVGYVDDKARRHELFTRYPFALSVDAADILTLGYPVQADAATWRLMPGNCDIPVLYFWRNAVRYDRYWVMEADVAYTGHFGALLDAFSESPSDLLCTSIRPRIRNWNHETLFRHPRGCDADDGGGYLAFLPFFRASHRFLAALDRFYRDGGAGHHEQVWPYVAERTGLAMEDLGGDGAFTREINRGRFYSSTPADLRLYPGSFRFRPNMTAPGAKPDTLWHPIKENADTRREYWRFVVRPWVIRRVTGLVEPVFPELISKLERRRRKLD